MVLGNIDPSIDPREPVASVQVSGTVVVEVPVEAASQAATASVIDLDEGKRIVLRAVLT